ncbi:MAG: helix-turn-helix domain-containing protein [Rhodospirillaceae bacterium]
MKLTRPLIASPLASNPVNFGHHPKLLTTAEAARRITVTTRTLERWRTDGRGPRHLRLSTGVIRYDEHAIEEFLAASERRSTSDQGRG